MSLDDILGAADAAQDRQRQRDDTQAAETARAVSADAQFADHLREWMPNAAGRLRGADVPTLSAVDAAGAPAVVGWVVYACVPGDATGRDGYGRPGMSRETPPWGQRAHYDALVGGFRTAPRVMLTTDGGGLVVAFTLGMPDHTRSGYVPGGYYSAVLPHGCPTFSDPMLERVGRRLMDLSRGEMFALAGLTFAAAAHSAGIDMVTLSTARRETEDRVLSGQLLNWELGVRRLLAHHAHGLPLY